jgi:subtilisin-like proprotein convertase family protein
MKIKLLLAASLLFCGLSNAQSPSWKPVNDGSLKSAEKTERMAMPSEYHLFNADLAQLKAAMLTAPARSTGLPSSVIVPFPDADGKIQHYRMYEASVMQPELAAAYPDMKSYAGQGVEDPTASIRISVTSWGLHAMVLSSKGTFYTDPYTKDLQNYIVYKKENLFEDRQFACGVEEVPTEHDMIQSTQAVLSNDSKLRTYRLAMASTAQYSQFHVARAGLNAGTDAQKIAAVLAAMVVTVTRVDAVYERELAVTMQLVANNNLLIYLTEEDGLSNDNAGALLMQSQTVITSIIGSTNFDIGHTVSTGGGGVAGFGVVCNNEFKARGITGSPAPVGDPYDIDFVAHEMGHQFGGSHTFSGVGGSCQGNANSSTAVEPGGGTTIMAYAGICNNGNIQTNSNDYFHTVSLTQIFSFLGRISCATETVINNTAPVIPALTSYSIPYSTPFVLRGPVATDAQGDALTYTWEQTNAFGTLVDRPVAIATAGPNFRSLPPSASRERYFPRLADVLNGNLTPTWEVLPSVERILSFAYTVRDNNALGGQTSRQNISVNVRNTGPFRVTSQAAQNQSWAQGSQQTITWDVAGTTANNINTANVNILLSTDGGQTFTTVLAANTPNDGSEAITVPNVLAQSCRIMVEAAGNVYYAVNAAPFAIGYLVSSQCNTYTNTTSRPIPDNNPNFTTSIINVPVANTVQSVVVNVNITHSYVGDLGIIAVNPAGTQVVLWNGNCAANDNININFSDAGNTLSCTSTALGNTYRPFEALSTFNGQDAAGNWILALVDFGAGDVGALNSWSLTVCGQTFTPLSASQFNLNDFVLYPNPTTGSFTVQFTPASQEAIGITVHDMRGREVFKDSYTSAGLFSNSINLQNAQSGVYLVTVQNGTHKEVRKVVVQ